MAVTEVLTGFRQGQALVKRTKQWQFMKMASVWCQTAFRWEKRGSGIGALQNIGDYPSGGRSLLNKYFVSIKKLNQVCDPRGFAAFSATPATSRYSPRSAAPHPC